MQTTVKALARKLLINYGASKHFQQFQDRMTNTIREQVKRELVREMGEAFKIRFTARQVSEILELTDVSVKVLAKWK